MKSVLKISAVLISFFLLVGCTTGTGVMASSGGIYTVTKSGQSGFVSLGSLRKEAYDEANQFAASKGMIAEVISVNEIPTGFMIFPQVDLKFRLVTAANRAAASKAPSVSVTNSAAYSATGSQTDSTSSLYVNKEVDFYAELKKLGELKDRGLLSEEEFAKEKKRLLESREK